MTGSTAGAATRKHAARLQQPRQSTLRGGEGSVQAAHRAGRRSFALVLIAVAYAVPGSAAARPAQTYLVHVAGYDLGLIMRLLVGSGTPRGLGPHLGAPAGPQPTPSPPSSASPPAAKPQCSSSRRDGAARLKADFLNALLSGAEVVRSVPCPHRANSGPPFGALFRAKADRIYRREARRFSPCHSPCDSAPRGAPFSCLPSYAAASSAPVAGQRGPHRLLGSRSPRVRGLHRASRSRRPRRTPLRLGDQGVQVGYAGSSRTDPHSYCLDVAGDVDGGMATAVACRSAGSMASDIARLLYPARARSPRLFSHAVSVRSGQTFWLTVQTGRSCRQSGRHDRERWCSLGRVCLVPGVVCCSERRRRLSNAASARRLRL